MWIFSRVGFVSVVEDRQTPGNLLVRGRVRADVAKLFPGYPVETTPGRDYRFRTSVPRAAVASIVAEQVRGIDYDNFKNSTPQDRHAPYMDVWEVMYRMQVRRMPAARRGRGKGRSKARLTAYPDESWYGQPGHLEHDELNLYGDYGGRSGRAGG